LPVLKDIKDFIVVYAYDCAHPQVAERISYDGEFAVCDPAKNPNKAPSMTLIR